jgi:hypothetical protein
VLNCLVIVRVVRKVQKMTDNEIIKALECCDEIDNNWDSSKCFEKCPYKGECARRIMADTLDLINRQKAEISELQRRNSELEIELKAMRGAANSYKAEVERLCVELDEVIIAKDLLFDEAEALIKKNKAEAIKEFAERLKEKGTPVTGGKGFEGVYVMCSNIVIDNLVKKMVGDYDDR